MFVRLTQDILGRKAGEHIDVGDTDAQQLIAQGTAQPLADDPLTPAVHRAVEGALDQMAQRLEQIMDASLKQFADAQRRARKNAVPLLFGDGGDGDPRGKSFGDWLLCVRTRNDKRLGEVYGSQKAALNTGTGTQGGYLVPTEFVPRLMSLVAERAVVRPKATVIPMGSRSIQVPTLDLATDPAADDTQFFGGLVAAWTEEAVAQTEKEPQFKQIEIVAYELSGYSLVSNTLLADSAVGLEALLTQLFGDAIAWYEDLAFLRGSGAGKPLGIMESACALAVTRNAANDFKLVDAAKMLGRLLPGWSPATTSWVVSPSVLEKLIQLADGSSRAIWIPNAREKLPMTLFGLPVAISEKMKQLGTAKDVLLADLRHYLIGDRQQIEIAFSEHFKFTNNQGAWRFVSRVGGQPWLRGVVNLAGQTDTVSPFVYLN